MTTSTTVAHLTARVHRLANGSRRQTVNYLSAGIDNDDISMVLVDDIDAIAVGSYLGLEEEIVYVRAVNENTKTVTIRRGMFNTTAAAHLADVQVEIDWRWFTADVVDAIADEIRGWPNDEIFVVATLDAVAASSRAVSISPMRFRFPLLVQRTVSGRAGWIDVTGSYEVVNTANGYQLYFPSTALGSGSIRLHYAQDLDTATITSATALTAIGLTPNLHDAAIFGATSRLLMGDEGQRSSTTSQPEPRQAQDVRIGAAFQTGAAYRQMADQRLADEAARLRSKYPYRRF